VQLCKKIKIRELFNDLAMQIGAVIRRKKAFVSARVLKYFQRLFAVLARYGLDHYKKNNKVFLNIALVQALTFFEDDGASA